MRKLVLAASLTAIAAASTPASAADMDYEREVGLIVSGVVDKWAGVQILDNPLPSNAVLIGFDGEDTIMATGGEGRLSLPLGNNWSVQSDVKYEYNSNALENATSNNVIGPRYSYQGAAHFSYRDPGSFLIGVFGGAGGYNAGTAAIQTNARFVGGEAQMYFDNITLYVQGGYVNYDAPGIDPSFTLDDGVFARGVLRWFLGNSFIGSDSRLQLEGSYHVPGTATRSTVIWTPSLLAHAMTSTSTCRSPGKRRCSLATAGRSATIARSVLSLAWTITPS